MAKESAKELEERETNIKEHAVNEIDRFSMSWIIPKSSAGGNFELIAASSP